MANHWSGGQTFEYFIAPETASYADRDFEFRISSASIEMIPSDFTRFPGYFRYLVMLDTDLSLEINGERRVCLQNEILRFDSNDQVISHTSGTDFNWMISNSYTVHSLDLKRELFTSQVDFCLVFALEATVVSINGEILNLNANDCLLIDNESSPTTIQIIANRMAIIGTLNR